MGSSKGKVVCRPSCHFGKAGDDDDGWQQIFPFSFLFGVAVFFFLEFQKILIKEFVLTGKLNSHKIDDVFVFVMSK